MNDNPIYKAATWRIPLVIAIVFHEVAHGFVARLLGDDTASRLGRLSLNPVRHVDPVGTLLVPMMLALVQAPIFGWAKPVPVVADRMRHPRWDMALVALAGPGTNLILALIAAIALAIWIKTSGMPAKDGAAGFLIANLFNFLQINVFLAIFNLLPIPPFDGGHVMEAALPRPMAVQFAKLHRFAFPVMLFLLVVLPSLIPGANVVARVVGPIADTVMDSLLGFVSLG